MHYISGIRVRDPSNEYAADLCHRPRASGIDWDAKIIIDAYLCSYTKVINQILICITSIRLPNTKSLKSLRFYFFFILYNDQHMHNWLFHTGRWKWDLNNLREIILNFK